MTRFVRIEWILHPGTGLFFASFLSLFLELLLIRWVPSLIRVVAYYGNLMLISSFLGLGCGMLLWRRRLGLQKWFGLLFFLLVAFVSALKGREFELALDEIRFLPPSTTGTAVPLGCVFILNALLFVPLGELIGSYFERLPPLRAYAWDLGGAITGTLLFGLFSYFWFSPILGFTAAMVIYLLYCRGIRLVMTVFLFFASLVITTLGTDKAATWSPYNHLAVEKFDAGGGAESEFIPKEKIGSMRDPPFYVVQINSDFYMYSGSIDGRRYTKSHPLLFGLAEQYALPHWIRPNADAVLVVGSGSGIDVEAALLYGARVVDAVEIDPLIIKIGREYNASGAYEDARVSIHNTDSRAFFKQTKGRYDLIVFGFLDSQSLFSQMSNVRLDAYVYTAESFREAFRLLKPGGFLSISFFSAHQPWLIDRLVNMVNSINDAVPLVYGNSTGKFVIFLGKEVAAQGPQAFLTYERLEWKSLRTSEATDDWPYLYLERRFIPRDYLINIGLLLAASLVLVSLSSGKSGKGVDPHFFFLGAGFLLLETKSITTLSLYFGTTWLVSMLAILGVLLMVLLANFVALRQKKFSLLFYLPLAASIAFLYWFPNHYVLSWPYLARIGYSLLVIPLPIFFAGLIFSFTFRASKDPTYAFGSNLLGAMVGGFSEYLAMITGMKALLLVVLVFYLASLWVRLRSAQHLETAV